MGGATPGQREVAADVQQQNQSPPGITSPFGTDGNCATPN